MAEAPQFAEKEVRDEMFTVFDEDLDGFITVKDLLRLVEKSFKENAIASMPSEEAIAKAFAEADQNSDGKINQEEWNVLLKALDL